MKKRIAVFICAISFDNQRRILKGILKGAKERKVDIFVFTCHLNFLENNSSKQGAYNIMNLADIKKFDGVILVKNTIQYPETADKLVSRILESKVPAVSIDEHIEGMSYVGISSYHAQRTIIEHLVNEHKQTDINYVTGHISNREGMERYQAYLDVMGEHGLECGEQNVYYGNYDIDSGRRAVKAFLERNGGTLPQAIVCANDSMALGVVEQLAEFGYHVPEDVLVTGFDNDEFARMYVPSITTVERRQEDIGEQALKILLDSPDIIADYEKTAISLLRASCGCTCEDTVTLNQIKKKYVNKSIIIQKAVDSTKNMLTDLAGLECLEDLYERLQEYVLCSDMEAFYLCMCEEDAVFKSAKIELDDKIDITDINTSYTKNVSIPVAYENGVFQSCGDFPSGEVLPADCQNDEKSSFYIAVPVYYQNCCFGYCVTKNSYFSLESELFYSWVINIGIGMENIRKWILMNRMVQRLNGIWEYDMLTHLYNRTGFFYYAKRALEKMKKQQADAFIIFIDLDGLKRVNDYLGHEQGDWFICEMAEVLKHAVRPKDLVMRYGGDEYVIFGSCENELEIEACIERIQQGIAEKNKMVKRAYPLSASIGYSTYKACEIDNLSQLIEQADQMMYQEKRQKREKQKE